MSISSTKEQIKKALNFYQEYLKTVNEERFLYSPDPEIWSLSEIYAHVFWVASSSLIAVERCLNKTASIKSNPSNWKVRLILLLEILPGKNLKVPEVAAASVKRISKEEALNKIIGLRKKIEVLVPEFKRFDAHYKFRHPVLGWLDAKLWFKFVAVHTKHHIKQISRLEKLLQEKL